MSTIWILEIKLSLILSLPNYNYLSQISHKQSLIITHIRHDLQFSAIFNVTINFLCISSKMHLCPKYTHNTTGKEMKHKLTKHSEIRDRTDECSVTINSIATSKAGFIIVSQQRFFNTKTSVGVTSVGVKLTLSTCHLFYIGLQKGAASRNFDPICIHKTEIYMCRDHIISKH